MSFMHRQRPLLASAFILAAVVASLHFAAVEHSLYWAYWWYDVMMHFLGGLAVGMFVYWVVFASGIIVKGAKSRSFVITWVFLSVLAVGISWEIFEYVNRFTDSHEGYALDTSNDLILDSCGAVLAALIATRKKRHG